MNEPSIKMITSFFNRGVPFVPFPIVERCLMLEPKESHMEIKEGYAIMAYDYTVKKSYSHCLFNMKETLNEREQHLLEKENERLGRNKLDLKKFEKMFNKGMW